MLSKAALIEAAEQCEAATEAGRDLDRVISHALGAITAPGWETWVPRYTASLDIALTVAAKDMHFRVDSGSPAEPDAKATVWTQRGRRVFGGTGAGSTPTLALVAAALRARAAEREETEEPDDPR